MQHPQLCTSSSASAYTAATGQKDKPPFLPSMAFRGAHGQVECDSLQGPTAMKRPCYSMYRVMSARYGVPMILKDRLHGPLFDLAETLPGVHSYALYTPTFTYHAGNRKRQSAFVIALAFEDGRKELWASTPDVEPCADSPLEAARRAHAEELGARYRLFTQKELYANRIVLKNRRVLRDNLAFWRHVDSGKAETLILRKLPPGQPTRLDELAQRTKCESSKARLAAFRLVTRGLVKSDLENTLISDAWRIWRPQDA